MSAIQTVTALIEEIGAGTVDDILADMEGYTRRQVIKALDNAAYAGLITCDGYAGARKGPGARGSLPATYRAIKKTQSRPAASVWHFAQLQAA
jgi:predicted enzyme involved in methoxymalonyl-ACP biosynthesis